MTTKRFTTFPKKNEDTILDECGFPEALYSNNDYRFYIASEELVFLFVEEQDIEWIKKPDAFSVKIGNTMSKTMLVPEIEGNLFVVFIKENGKEYYTFYGVYRLSNAYTDEGGLSKAINVYTPLEFYLEYEDYVI